MRVTTLAALLAIAAVPHGSGAPEPVQNPDTPKLIREVRVREWISIVNEHEPGRTDAALRRLQGWTAVQLEELIGGLGEYLGRPSQLPIRTPEDRLRLLRRGAILHADLAMLARFDDAVAPAPQASRLAIPSVVVDDGQTTGFAANSVHWEIGRRVIDYMLRQPGRPPDEFVSLWYRGTSEFMIAGADYAATGPHLRTARALLARDAHVWLASGVVRASYAAPSVQNVMSAVKLPFGFSVQVNDQRTELNLADQYLSRAVELDPANAEAQLRYGWVLLQRNQRERGRASLRTAYATTKEPVLQYYASLFLGVADAAAGRPDEAAEAFERAAHLFPTAQAPLLALSELAFSRGDRPAAAAALDRLAALPARGRDDPWFTYDVEYGRSWRATMARLYTQLNRATR